MNSVCGKVPGDFARSVLHHHRAVADPDHAIFGNEHGAEQDPGIRADADRSTHHRGGRHAGAGGQPAVSRRAARRTGIIKNVGPHPTARVHHRSLPVLKAECRCAMSRKRPRTPTRGPRCGTTGPATAWTGTRPNRRRLPRRRRTIGKRTGWRLRPAATAGRSCRQTHPRHHLVVTYSDLSVHVNRRSARPSARFRPERWPPRSGHSARPRAGRTRIAGLLPGTEQVPDPPPMLQAAQRSQLKRRSGHAITLRHEGSVTPAIWNR